MSGALTVSMLMYPGANLLDAAGPLQVFASASHYGRALGYLSEPAYRVLVQTSDGRPVRTSMDVEVSASCGDASAAAADTFLVVGGFGSEQAVHDRAVIEAVVAGAGCARRYGSICTGTFVLAAAGLLRGKRVTTHWDYCDRLSAAAPEAEVLRDAIFVTDGRLWTSAGVLAGVDMALAMVEQDYGRPLADYTARQLVAPVRRGSSEPQVSAHLRARELEISRVRELMIWIADNPQEDLSTRALAGRGAMSVRSLHRHFASEAGVTPARFVELRRIEEAQRLLCGSDIRLEQVARKSGFASVAALRAAFLRKHGLSPAEFRSRFISRTQRSRT